MSERLARTLEMHRVPQAPLVRAVANGQFGMLGSDHPRDSFSRAKLAALPDPHVIVLAANFQPRDIACARYLLDWSRFVVIQAGDERREDYERVARMVPNYRRVLLIETLPHLAARWIRVAEHKPRLELVSER